MVNFTILAGGFAVPGFIATYNFDSDAGALSLLGQSSTGDSPSWIAQHPQNRSILYAVNEISPVGNLQSFTIEQNGSVSLVDTVTTGGNGPTFTNPLSTGEVSAMNFGSPNCSFVATVEGDPLHFRTDSPVLSFPVPEGAKSNPHMSLEHNGEIFVPVLGGDKIWRIVNDGAPGKFKVQGQINVDPGTGPRHIAIHDDILFVLHETASTLTAQHIPEGPNGTTLPLLANVSIIPQDALEGSQFAAAELLISTPTEKFPNPLIYVSNRNISPNVTDPRGDTIAIFEFINGTDSTNGTETGSGTNQAASTTCKRKRMVKRNQRFRRDGEALNLLAQVPTGLQQIRSMALGKVEDGGDEFIIAGANTAGGVAVFQRVDGGRNLTLVARNEEIANRTSFVFV
ncbi:putative isomerase YbhE [Dendrothele bispora CBS 962.96]|uniref:Putative isomerase YbhE n=1 Tax=Dendrothele bispora (strain CBS 962.96) TaxID=1314807 RepID=A0A4S8L4Y4_DENBC|nr:putative isomerase YbhE [Dendrothele bispora CBS 962.96]